MATYQVLRWHEIPTQVKAEEGGEEINVPLDGRLMERVDEVATKRGLTGTDEYLDGWQWTEPEQREGDFDKVISCARFFEHRTKQHEGDGESAGT